MNEIIEGLRRATDEITRQRMALEAMNASADAELFAIDMKLREAWGLIQVAKTKLSHLSTKAEKI